MNGRGIVSARGKNGPRELASASATSGTTLPRPGHIGVADATYADIYGPVSRVDRYQKLYNFNFSLDVNFRF